MRETTEIRIDEHGDETHESWVLIRANNISTSGGSRLFDSEISHQHTIIVEASRCTRKRDLNHDHLYSREIILVLEMSQAQWGAFVSSFGNGNGVPATLRRLVGVGEVPAAPFESRLAESVKDVRESGDEAFGEIQEQFATVEAIFERGGGRKEMREAIRTLHYTIKNAPANMEFAATSLNKHVENVVTKARADIEGMVLAAQAQGELDRPDVYGLLGTSEEDES